jgi:glycosyltransferase involved in cell wall biosynthesis
MDACARADVPLVAHFHGWDAYVLPQRPDMMNSYRRLFAQAVGFVAVSRHMVEQLVSLGAPAERVHWNPCGARVPATEARPADAPPAFVAVGRFTGKKAPFLTLAAFARVRERHPDARLDMIGDGPLLPASQQLARGLGIDDAVTFHGATEHDRVYELLASGRCFVQHSVTAPDGDREGTPVSVLEAMALGVPVVSTRHTGIQDVVAEGTCGTLVDEYDVEGMAEAMSAYAADPEHARRVGAAAREAVVSTWSMDRSIARLWSIVRHAAGFELPAPDQGTFLPPQPGG